MPFRRTQKKLPRSPLSQAAAFPLGGEKFISWYFGVFCYCKAHFTLNMDKLCLRRKHDRRRRFRRQSGNVNVRFPRLCYARPCGLSLFDALTRISAARRARRTHRNTRLWPRPAAAHAITICLPPRRRWTARCAARLVSRSVPPESGPRCRRARSGSPGQ